MHTSVCSRPSFRSLVPPHYPSSPPLHFIGSAHITSATKVANRLCNCCGRGLARARIQRMSIDEVRAEEAGRHHHDAPRALYKERSRESRRMNRTVPALGVFELLLVLNLSELRCRCTSELVLLKMDGNDLGILTCVMRIERRGGRTSWNL
jgi:hypothetical protein